MCIQSIPTDKLRSHSSEFRKELIKVDEQIYFAVGYAASNVSMLVGDDGIIIIDSTESTSAAEDILKEFRTVTSLPVKMIIYTHSHRDHISGSSVFAEGADPEIIARANLSPDLNEGKDAKPSPKQVMLQRTKRQFGIGLEDGSERINLGLGPSNRPTKGLGEGFLQPTKTFSGDRFDITVAGINLQLHAAPGETEDHLVVWMESRKALFSGDNFYHSFPNLYAIRGTKYRDFGVWADTMDELANFNAEHLLPGHSRPISGQLEIRQRLEDYRDAIRSVVDQTVALMNKGLTPDDIATLVKLPDNLIDKPYLQEFYGSVAYAARAYFAGTMGWFDGNPTTLNPEVPAIKAYKTLDLMGGADRVLSQLESLQSESDHQWVCELSDLLLAVNFKVETVKNVKASSLEAMADEQINATTRNYYLVYAKELRGTL